MDEPDGRVWRVALGLEPFVWQMQPLHSESAQGNAMRDDHQPMKSTGVPVSMVGSETLVNAYSYVESTLTHWEARPKFAFKLLMFGVMSMLFWEYSRQFLFRNSIKETKLLFNQSHLFASIP